MNAQVIREKGFALGEQIKDLVWQFESETDTTVTDLAVCRGTVLGERHGPILSVQVGVKVL